MVQWFARMKFIHHARDHYYGERAIEAEAGRLLELLLGALAARLA
jgi:hypothetical protein